MKVVLALTLVPRIGARHILAELLALATRGAVGGIPDPVLSI